MLASQRKFLAVTCLLLLVLVAALATAFNLRFSYEMKQQFYVRAELFARTFSDQIQFRLVQNTADSDALAENLDHFVEDRVRGEVIYAQVVLDGRIVAEQRSYVVEQAQLEFAPLKLSLALSQHTLPSGAPYLDVRRALVNGPQLVAPDSYVRLGFSLLSLQHEILSQVLQTSAWSLGGALLSLLLLVGAFRYWYVPPSAAVARATVPAYEQREGRSAVTDNGYVRLKLGDLSVDDRAKSVRIKGEEVPMSPREYALLKLFISHPGRIFSNEEIVKHVWSDDQFAIPQDVKKYVYLLRKKLEGDPKNPTRLLTVRGFGYKLVNGASLTGFDSS